MNENEPPKLPTPQQKGDNRWTARYWITQKGKRIRKDAYGKTEEMAIQARAEILQLIADLASTEKYEPGSFAWLAAGEWKAELRQNTEISTRDRYATSLRCRILPRIGAKQLADITFADVQGIRDDKARYDGRKGDASAKTRREALCLVKTILKYAKLRQMITVDPAEHVALPKITKKKFREEPEDDFTIRLMQTCRADPLDYWMEGPIFCASTLALRNGEVCALKKKHIDRKNLHIVIAEQRRPKENAERLPKGQKIRMIPVTESIIAWLDRYASQSKGAYVFTQKDGKPIFPNEVTEKGPALCIKAGLQRRTFHDLRSFATSNLLALGVDPVTIMEILGHENIDTTLLYINVHTAQKRDAMRRLFESFGLAQ